MKFESDTENIIIPLIIFHSFGNCYNQFINFLPIFLFQNAHNLSIFSIYGDTSHWFLEIFRILVQIEKDTRRCFNDTLDPIATIDRSEGSERSREQIYAHPRLMRIRTRKSRN